MAVMKIDGDYCDDHDDYVVGMVVVFIQEEIGILQLKLQRIF